MLIRGLPHNYITMGMLSGEKNACWKMVSSSSELWALFCSWGAPHRSAMKVVTGCTERLGSWALGLLSCSDKPDCFFDTNMKVFALTPLTTSICLIFFKFEIVYLFVLKDANPMLSKLERNWEKAGQASELKSTIESCRWLSSHLLTWFLVSVEHITVQKSTTPWCSSSPYFMLTMWEFCKEQNSMRGSLTKAISTLEYVTMQQDTQGNI